MNLSKNFTLKEMLRSKKADENGFTEQNIPDIEVIENLTGLAKNTLQIIRDLFGGIIVTSGYRCHRLNKLVNGSSTSQHLKGEAADIKSLKYSPRELYVLILDSGIVFDQIILEFDSWVHISYKSKGVNRKQKLEAVYRNNKTKYIDYD
jgi:hypothetical protein